MRRVRSEVVRGAGPGPRRKRLRAGRSSCRMESAELLRCEESGAHLLSYALSNINGVEVGATMHTSLGF